MSGYAVNRGAGNHGAGNRGVGNRGEHFRSMLVKLASSIEDEDLPKLKTALFDIICSAAEIERATSTLDLFNLLVSGGHICDTDVGLLFELFEVTGLQELHTIMTIDDEDYYRRNEDTSMITDYRRMLIELGNSLEEDDVKSVATLFNIKKKDSKDNWDLINTLTRQMILDNNLGPIRQFCNQLNGHDDLKRVQDIVQSYVQMKSEMRNQVRAEDGLME